MKQKYIFITLLTSALSFAAFGSEIQPEPENSNNATTISAEKEVISPEEGLKNIVVILNAIANFNKEALTADAEMAKELTDTVNKLHLVVQRWTTEYKVDEIAVLMEICRIVNGVPLDRAQATNYYSDLQEEANAPNEKDNSNN